MKLHDAEEKYQKQKELLGADNDNSPIIETMNLVTSEWPAKNEKKFKSRMKSLESSNDDFPMHLIMLRLGQAVSIITLR